MFSSPPATSQTLNCSRFQQIDAALAARVAAEFGSPLYLIDLAGLRDRFLEFSEQTAKHDPARVVAVSYKTNPTPELLRRLHRLGAYAEVVSSAEYQMAAGLQVPAEKIIFNGPAKRDEDLRVALRGGSQINCDHFDEVKRIERIAADAGKVATIGMRLSLPIRSTFSRFGFQAAEPYPECEAFRVAQWIVSSPHLKLGGIHAQAGTNIRDMRIFNRQSRGQAEFALALQKRLGVELEWINVGGGLAGIAAHVDEEQAQYPLPSIEEYCQAVMSPILDCFADRPSRPVIFFEPGRTLFDPAGALLTTVLGTRPAVDVLPPSLICDAGITSLAFAGEFELPIHVCAQRTGKNHYDLFGPSCMQRDQIGRVRELPDLRLGDHLVFYGVGAYCLALANSFINYRPGMVGWCADGHFDWIRLPEDHDHWHRLQRVSGDDER